MNEQKQKKTRFGLIMTVYLLGIFMGALDTGIVTPARTVIQESLGVSETAGIWMITIYTLAYASSIPVMGKLADRMGRRTIYLISIALFGGGSLICGLSHYAGSFTLLLIARAIQAIGGGGIVPIANAEFGTTFPEEKRGMALGMVGGVYGIANVFGASAGSLVLDIFGLEHWEFIFYVNVPIAAFIFIVGIFCLPNNKDKSVARIDGLGTGILVVMVLSIMYGLKNIDFFDFIPTLTSTKVFPFLIIFAVLLPVFIIVEKKAEDPVLNLKFFTNVRILVTLLVSIITGIVMIGVIFIPQLCENAVEVPTGSGGYFVIALGLCAGIGAMTSGKLTDKFGPKIVLIFGLLSAIAGSCVIIFFTTVTPGRINVFAALMLIGLGIGFVMGAPLNYMMLWEVETKEANSALATLSLVRSLGTVVAPAIMIGFLAHAGGALSDNLMEIMPNKINVSEIEADMSAMMPEMSGEMAATMGEGTEMPADMAAAMGEETAVMPDMSAMTEMLDKMQNMEMDFSSMDGDMELPEELLSELQNSDVTTITDAVVDMSSYFFTKMSGEVIDKVTSNEDIPDEMKDTITDAMGEAFLTAEEDYEAQIREKEQEIRKTYQDTLGVGFRQMYIMTGIGSLVGILLLLLYRRKPQKKQ